MSTEQLTAIIGAALGAGGLGAIVTYLIARRRTSGQVGTTDADRLWSQNEKLIDRQKDDIIDLRTQMQGLRDRLMHYETRDLTREGDYRECLKRSDVFEARMKAAEKILLAKAEVAEAKVSVAEGELTVAEKKQEITELKEQVKQANGGENA